MMKYEDYLPGLNLNGFGKKNLKAILQSRWASIVQPFQKWKLAQISASPELSNMRKFLAAKFTSNMEIRLGSKYWTLKPPMNVQEAFVRPWLVEYSASDQGVDYFRDEIGNGFLISSEKDPADFLFETADAALNAYYQRKIQLNESKMMELMQENTIYYTMIKSIL
jgi:hypothetical protein